MTKPEPDTNATHGSDAPHEPGDSGHNATTRAVLDAFAEGNPDDQLLLGDLVSGLRHTAFGMLLFVGVLPAFLPLPGVAGALSGPLVMLIGAQLLIGLNKPWLPSFLARRGPHRKSMQRFHDVMAPWLLRLEKLVRRNTFLMKCLIISSALSKSAMTPSRIGRIASMLPGVRPSISFASSPTARTCPFQGADTITGRGA